MQIAKGHVYQPEDIAPMKTVLDEPATILPVARVTSALSSQLGSWHLQPAASAIRSN
jgi:hypothetical protein